MGDVSPRLKPRLEPEESCPSCGRPVALAGRDHCVYCGSSLHHAALPHKDPQIPAEFLLAEDSGAFRMSPMMRWGLRWAGVIIAGLIIGILMSGACGG